MDVKKNIFILTGAGISKESGIQTFREKDGLWDNHRIEDVCTVDAFLRYMFLDQGVRGLDFWAQASPVT